MYEQVQAGFGAVSGKLDQTIAGVADLKPRLAALEVARATAHAKVAWVKKSLIGLVLTGLGALAAKLSAGLWP